MENESRTYIEAQATREVIDSLDADALGDMPVSAVAGALMRASVILAVERYGEAAPDECRRALERVLNDMNIHYRKLN